MTNPEPSTASRTLPDVEMVARAWHALGDEALDAIPFDGDGCSCRNYAPHALRVLELFFGDPLPEPDGLGAVVVNPVTGKVYVRDAHPALPWHNPDENASEQWSDPTREDWFIWEDLPRPLVVHSPGWTPPAPPIASEPLRVMEEPTGIGAVVVDAHGQTWVRVRDKGHPWQRVADADPATGEQAGPEGYGRVEEWADLDRPVLRSPGWNR